MNIQLTQGEPAGHGRTDHHEYVLGVVSLRRERERSYRERVGGKHEEEQRVLGHHDYSEQGESDAMVLVATKPLPLDRVFRAQVVNGAIGQDPEHEGGAAAVIAEPQHLALAGDGEQDQREGGINGDGRDADAATALADVLADHEPEGAEKAGSGDHRVERADEIVLLGQPRGQLARRIVVLQDGGHVEEVEHERDAGEQHRLPLRYQIRGKANRRRQCRDENNQERLVENRQSHRPLRSSQPASNPLFKLIISLRGEFRGPGEAIESDGGLDGALRSPNASLEGELWRRARAKTLEQKAYETVTALNYLTKSQ